MAENPSPSCRRGGGSGAGGAGGAGAAGGGCGEPPAQGPVWSRGRPADGSTLPRPRGRHRRHARAGAAARRSGPCLSRKGGRGLRRRRVHPVESVSTGWGAPGWARHRVLNDSDLLCTTGPAQPEGRPSRLGGHARGRAFKPVSVPGPGLGTRHAGPPGRRAQIESESPRRPGQPTRGVAGRRAERQSVLY